MKWTSLFASTSQFAFLLSLIMSRKTQGDYVEGNVNIYAK